MFKKSSNYKNVEQYAKGETEGGTSVERLTGHFFQLTPIHFNNFLDGRSILSRLV
jgi:hypothetical protein